MKRKKSALWKRNFPPFSGILTDRPLTDDDGPTDRQRPISTYELEQADGKDFGTPWIYHAPAGLGVSGSLGANSRLLARLLRLGLDCLAGGGKIQYFIIKFLFLWKIENWKR